MSAPRPSPPGGAQQARPQPPPPSPPPRNTPQPRKAAQTRPGRLPKLRRDTGFFAPVDPVGECGNAAACMPNTKKAMPAFFRPVTSQPLSLSHPHNTAAADLPSPLAAVTARDPTVKGGRWDPEFVWNTDWERAVS